MNYILSFLLLIIISNLSSAQIDNGNVYIPNSCTGDFISKTISLSAYEYEDSNLYFKGSNIPTLKAYINGIEIDPTNEIDFTQKKIDIVLEFEIPKKKTGLKIYYTIVKGEETQRVQIPIHLSTYTINKNQTYIQTLNACTEQVQWALPFYATQTDIYLYDITDGQKKHVSSSTFYCCSWGNIISMPRDTKGKFIAYVSGCYTSDSFTFEVNTLNKN